MRGGETIAAIAFYCGLVALAAGAMLAARGAIERRAAPRRAIVLVAVGVVAIGFAVVVFANGPRGMLPF